MLSLLKKVRMSPSLRPRVYFSWMLMLLYQMGFVLSWIVITSLFVESYGIQNLPWLFAAEAGLIITGSIVTHTIRNEKHDRFLKLVIATLFVLIGVAFIFRNKNLLLFFSAAIAAKDLVYPQLRLGITRKCEELFTPTEAQRALPLVESGLTIGMIASSALVLLLLWLFPTLPTHDVLFGWTLPLLGIFVLLIFEPTLLKEIPQFHHKKTNIAEQIESRTTLRSMFQKYAFVQILAAVTLLQGTLFAVTEFQFMKIQSEHFEHPTTNIEVNVPTRALQASLFDAIKIDAERVSTYAEHTAHVISSKVIAHKTLMHDLGFLSLIFGFVALLVQFFLSTELLRRFGIIRTMALYFFGFLWMASLFVFGSAGAINWVRGYEHGFHSLFMAGYHLSFYSAFARVREKFRLFLEGIVAPTGILLGVVFLFGFNDSWIKYSLLGLSFVLILTTLAMRRSFSRFSVAHLHNTTNPHEQLHAIEILGQKDHKNAAKLLATELLDTTSHPIFRKKIIQTLTKIGDPRTLHAYLEILRSDDETDEIKIEVLDSLLQFENFPKYWRNRAFTQHQTQKTLQKLFASTKNNHLQKLLTMNILRHLPLEKTVTFLQTTLQSADEKLKSICLRSCAVFDDPELRHYLRPYLNDPSTRVRSHAVIALWNIDEHDTLLKTLEPMLHSTDPNELISGIYALGEINHHTSEIDLTNFADHENKFVRLHSLIALGKQNNRTVIEPLIKLLLGNDIELSRAVFGMSKRLPTDLREKLEHALQHDVSRRVNSVLKKSDFDNAELEQLHWWYQLTNRHADALLLEKFRTATN